MQIVGHNVAGFLKDAVESKLSSVGARQVNVNNDENSVTAYFSTASGHRYGFKLNIVEVDPQAGTERTAPEQVESVVQRTLGNGAPTPTPATKTSYDVLVEILGEIKGLRDDVRNIDL